MMVDAELGAIESDMFDVEFGTGNERMKFQKLVTHNLYKSSDQHSIICCKDPSLMYHQPNRASAKHIHPLQCSFQFSVNGKYMATCMCMYVRRLLESERY